MSELRPYPGAPRWVKLSGIIATVVTILLVVAMLAAGGLTCHGPGSDRHCNGSARSASSGEDR